MPALGLRRGLRERNIGELLARAWGRVFLSFSEIWVHKQSQLFPCCGFYLLNVGWDDKMPGSVTLREGGPAVDDGTPPVTFPTSLPSRPGAVPYHLHYVSHTGIFSVASFKIRALNFSSWMNDSEYHSCFFIFNFFIIDYFPSGPLTRTWGNF